MKPNGLRMDLVGGLPTLRTTASDRATDQIWEAVREAICANMTPERFKREAAQAWGYELKQQAEYASDVLLGK